MKENPVTALRSRKVYLRRPAPADLDELVERYRRSRKLFRGLASSRYDSAAFEKLLKGAELETNETFLICRVDDDAIVGQISLSQIFRKAFQNAYLGTSYSAVTRDTDI